MVISYYDNDGLAHYIRDYLKTTYIESYSSTNLNPQLVFLIVRCSAISYDANPGKPA